MSEAAQPFTFNEARYKVLLRIGGGLGIEKAGSPHGACKGRWVTGQI